MPKDTTPAVQASPTSYVVEGDKVTLGGKPVPAEEAKRITAGLKITRERLAAARAGKTED